MDNRLIAYTSSRREIDGEERVFRTRFGVAFPHKRADGTTLGSTPPDVPEFRIPRRWCRTRVPARRIPRASAQDLPNGKLRVVPAQAVRDAPPARRATKRRRGVRRA